MRIPVGVNGKEMVWAAKPNDTAGIEAIGGGGARAKPPNQPSREVLFVHAIVKLSVFR